MNDPRLPWFVYILECADSTLYTGITTEPARRLGQHNAGTGARYTAARRPVQMVYCEPAGSRSAASKREAQLKKLPRAKKLEMIAQEGSSKMTHRSMNLWQCVFAIGLVVMGSGGCDVPPFADPKDTQTDLPLASDSSSIPDTASESWSTETDISSETDTPLVTDTSEATASQSAADTGSDSEPAVPCMSAIVTDIDETLTTLDSEWLLQVINPGHDPAMRPNANTLMQGYAELGYHVFYLTARGEALRLLDGTSAREASRRWLEDHDFPFEQGDLFLASGLAALDDAAATYKQGKVEDLMAEGWSIAYAYGNATSDIEAYKKAGIPNDRIFLVGKLAGQMGVVPVPTAEAYTEHLEEFFSTVPPTECP